MHDLTPEERTPEEREFWARVEAAHHERLADAGKWVASLGLNPADHGLPGKPAGRPTLIARKLEQEAFALVHRLGRRKAT